MFYGSFVLVIVSMLALHVLISYTFMEAVPAYPKSSAKRDYGRRDELPPPLPRSRAATEYGSRVPTERRSSYRDDYPSRGSAYSDIPPRSAPRTADRRAYIDDYGRKLERPIPTYREGRSRDYDSISGSKRPYTELVSFFVPICPLFFCLLWVFFYLMLSLKLVLRMMPLDMLM